MSSDDQRPPQDNEPLERDNLQLGEADSVAQYTRAHEMIERLRSGQAPERTEAGEDDLRLDATAALLRSATPNAANVDQEFAARLLSRLEAERAHPAETATPVTASASTQALAHTAHTIETDNKHNVSRRGLVMGGLGAAAAAVIGAAAGAAIEREAQRPAQVPQKALIPDGVGAWVAVAAIADIPVGAVHRFQTEAVIGYIRHTAAGFVALSGVCTHMACLLQWNSVERTFDCPCHGTQFLETGQQAPGAPYTYAPLPPIQTKVEQERVWVYVISSSGSTPASTPTRRYGASVESGDW